MTLILAARRLSRPPGKAWRPGHTPAGRRQKVHNRQDVELFKNWLYDTVQFIDGIPVISLKSLIDMKQRLGREKDRRDIRLIAVFLAKK